MKRKLLLQFVILFSTSVLHVFAQPGTLDNTFASAGKLINSIGFPDFNPSNMAIQADGKIVMAGYANYTTNNYDFVLARFNTNGSLDNTFDGDGMVTTDILGGSYDQAARVIILSSGKILVGGYSETNLGAYAVLARYNSNGSLDNTFDVDGKVSLIVPSMNSLDDMLVQSDNKIVLAGTLGSKFLLVRFDANGVPDNLFGTTGVASPDLGTDIYFATSVAIQADNKLLVCGTVSNVVTQDVSFATARYNTNGTLDNSFDGDGKVITDVGPDNDQAADISVQSNGNILVTGTAFGRLGNITYTAAARYTSTGALDITFDGDGKFTLNSSTKYFSLGNHFIMSDGKILMGGIFKNTSGNYDFALLKLTAAGVPDNTFDGDGIATSPANTNEEYGFGVDVQSDGKILLGGFASNGISIPASIARFNSNGTIDNSFDTDGFNTINFGNAPDYDEARVVKLQTDGKIVVAGSYYSNSLSGIFVARYNSNGSPDNTFGTSGKAYRILPVNSEVGSMQIQADGKIVVTGPQYDILDGTNIYLLRFNANGTLDNTFGNAGLVSSDISQGYDVGQSIAIQTDNKIVITAVTSDFQSYLEHLIIRYNGNGTPDNTFGTGGIVQTAMAPETINEDINNTQSIALQADGKIIIVTSKLAAGNEDFAIRRYNTNGTPDNSFNSGNIVTTNFSGFADIPYAVTVQADGNILVAGESGTGPNSKIALARYTPSGALDNNFNGNGKLTLTAANDHAANSVAVMVDGRIIVGGYTTVISGSNFYTYMLAARINSNGTTENSFGTNGISVVDAAVTPKFDFCNSMALQTDGKILLAGRTSVNSQDDMAVYRLNGSFPTSVISLNSPLYLITATPNPVTDKLLLKADGLPNGRYQYNITTMDGKLIASSFIMVNNRQVQQYIPAANWPKGVLMISISNNKESRTFKLVKN